MGIDPVAVDETNVHSHNRYAYGNNNPYKFTDPNGNTPIDIVFLAVDIGRLGVAAYNGEALGSAAVDVAISAASVFSPVPGVGQAYKAGRAAEKVVEATKAFDNASEAGVVYLRTNLKTGEKYIGQAKSEERFVARQKEHNYKLQEEHDYKVLGNAKAGKYLDVLEEKMIRQQGGIQKEGGILANKRHQMSESNFRKHGGE